MSTAEIDCGTIAYESTGPANGSPVVFVSGYWMGGQVWRQVSQPLAYLGLRCIAPTWPMGAHSQALRPGADRTIYGVADGVAQCLAALDLNDVVLVATTPAVWSRNLSRCTIPSGSAAGC
jgi:pimeloyl-ACP methyl ester carboxylesterase